MAVDADTQITDLTVDDHACLTFGESEELFDLTAAFVRDGLASGLKVVWISDSAPQQATSELARRGVAVESALASGQLAAAECEGRLLSGQEFGAGRAMDAPGGAKSGFPFRLPRSRYGVQPLRSSAVRLKVDPDVRQSVRTRPCRR